MFMVWDKAVLQEQVQVRWVKMGGTLNDNAI